jgi:predicted deacylase
MSYPVELQAPNIAAYQHGNIDVDYVHQFDSGQPGPHVCVNAVMHGNEICGAIALDHLFKAQLRPKRGVLTLCFVNVGAFLRFDPKAPERSRFIDEDMNRVWVEGRLDSDQQSAELQRARALRPIFDSVDYLLDIHSMSTFSEPILLNNGLATERQLSRDMTYPRTVACGSGHIVGKRLIEYTPFNDISNDKTALLIECGQHWARDTTTAALDTALYFLRALDMLADGFFNTHVACATPPAQQMLDVTHGYTTKTDRFAFAQTFVGLEEFAEQGTLIATDGDEEIRTPYPRCVLVMPHAVSEKNKRALRFARHSEN